MTVHGEYKMNSIVYLNQVLFICTANYACNIPWQLYDRMETIEVPGYTPAEKITIAEVFGVGVSFTFQLIGQKCPHALRTVILKAIIEQSPWLLSSSFGTA